MLPAAHGHGGSVVARPAAGATDRIWGIIEGPAETHSRRSPKAEENGEGAERGGSRRLTGDGGSPLSPRGASLLGPDGNDLKIALNLSPGITRERAHRRDDEPSNRLPIELF